MLEAPEDDLVAALATREIYPHRPAHVEHVQTHISHVFLAGDFVYKLKKPVRFSFLDFSTPAQRQLYCEEEVRLNRRLAPGIYLGVVPVTWGPDTGFALDGPGDVVAHLVWMRRLPAERMLVHLLSRDVPPPDLPDLLDRLGRRLAAFHAAAASDAEIAAHAAPETLRARFAESMVDEEPFVGRLVAAEDHAVLADFGARFVARHDTLLRARQDGGHVRDGHGDLHAEHVCDLEEPLSEVDGLPAVPAGLYVFDCIEFAPALRANDVASEVAFLAMDLERLGHGALASRFVQAYVAAADDPDVVCLLPFYTCYRACVRAKVASLKSVDAEVSVHERAAAEAQARAYLALATRKAWQAGAPVLIACCGLSGTGKTTIARELSRATGFAHVATDVLRRETPCEDPYAPGAREAIYDELLGELDGRLAAGESVIADATFLGRGHRDALAALARRHGRRHVFLLCEASEASIRRRLDARPAGSLSDARWATYLGQRRAFEPLVASEPAIRLDTDADVPEARAAAITALWQWRQDCRTPGHAHGA